MNLGYFSLFFCFFFSITVFILIKIFYSIQAKNHSIVALFHEQFYVRNLVKWFSCDLHLVIIQRSLQFCLECISLVKLMLILVKKTMCQQCKLSVHYYLTCSKKHVFGDGQSLLQAQEIMLVCKSSKFYMCSSLTVHVC